MVGAIIIILGLYLVVWGKSKDYDSPSPTIEDRLPAKQSVDDNNAKKQHSNLEVMTGKESIAQDEQV